MSEMRFTERSYKEITAQINLTDCQFTMIVSPEIYCHIFANSRFKILKYTEYAQYVQESLEGPAKVRGHREGRV